MVWILSGTMYIQIIWHTGVVVESLSSWFQEFSELFQTILVQCSIITKIITLITIF